jgi:divinyl protochlorophyllide a 8-vinyl-reductase
MSVQAAHGASLPGIETQRGAVGPNAVLQLVAPVRAAGGDSLLEDVFHRAGLSHYLATPPLAMVPQEEARRLFGAVREFLGPEAGDTVLREAGAGTAAYVMANRIPAFVRGLLRVLPPRPAGDLLLAAIQRHAWTFAGSGVCSVRKTGKTAVLEIEHNPLATPGCAWHAGVLETMFEQLVSQRTTLRHTACEARSGACCRFEFLLS